MAIIPTLHEVHAVVSCPTRKHEEVKVNAVTTGGIKTFQNLRRLYFKANVSSTQGNVAKCVFNHKIRFCTLFGFLTVSYTVSGIDYLPSYNMKSCP